MKLKKSPKPTVSVKRLADCKIQPVVRYWWGLDIERQIWIRERVAYPISRNRIFKRAYTETYPLEAKLDVDEDSINARIQAFIEAWEVKVNKPAA